MTRNADRKKCSPTARESGSLRRRGSCARARVFVELMAQEHAHGRAHGSPREQPNGASDDFSSELHALL